MACLLNLDEVMGYTAGERARWEHWFQSQPPTVLDASVQKEGDFQDVWRLIDHIFLVEKRHTLRLKGESPLPVETGVARRDLHALFAYGRTVRAEFTQFVHSAGDAALSRTIEFQYRGKDLRFTARKLIFHVLFHEIRHWAQIATAVRNAGFPPPGFHDLLFSDALE